MKIVICIDDTDNEDSRGTGQVATLLGRSIEETGLGKVSDVTRHQLLVHRTFLILHTTVQCVLRRKLRKRI